ncbi:MAG: thiamine pyrophosphate-dependent dehydrogenase E1 component subunit alpha [Planctomycetota bacterium]|nr:thiamine pyrophosphate-dependent dehydrogenase E1 component subunit alpha [Planctomycetota bacterium]
MATENPSHSKANEGQEVASSKTPSAMDTTPIQLGHIEVLQILNEHGEVDEGLEPSYSHDELIDMYTSMVRARAFDKRMLTMQRQGRMGTFAPNVGQEACIVGQVLPLNQGDWYAPSYRSFGAQIIRGWPMEHLMRLWAGFHDGFPPPKEVNDMPFSIVIGSHVLPAVGIGMGMTYKKDANCVVVNYGDGASSQGAVSEALNFAAVYKAPVVFVCENNGWAISTPTEKQANSEHFAKRGIAFDVPSIRVDGNDLFAMIKATEEAATRARNGEGPTLIEAVTYRMSLHTTADDPTVYREDSAVEAWEKRCPLLRFELYLKRKGVIEQSDIKAIETSCDEEVIEARDKFYAMEPADPTEIFDFMHIEMTEELNAQKAEYLKRLSDKGVTDE